MSHWIKWVDEVYRIAPRIAESFEKTWLYREAQKAVEINNVTHPQGAAPFASMVITLAETGKHEELRKIESVCVSAAKKNAKRIKDLKNDKINITSAAWTALSELSLLDDLIKNNPILRYDQTRNDKRTPDFEIDIDGKILGIEHTATDEGDHMRAEFKRAKEDLDRAVRVTRNLNELKKIKDETGEDVTCLIDDDEVKELTEATTGRRREPGKSFEKYSKGDIKREIDRHEVETTSAFSSMGFVCQRNPDKLQEVRSLRGLKNGEQVESCDYKILAISLPGMIFSYHDLVEQKRIPVQNESDLALIHSGVVWHAILGRQGDKIHNQEYEHLVKKGVERMTTTCDAEGILIDVDSPWQAVIISIFSAGLHKMDSQNTTTSGLIVSPHNLSPTRYLYLRTDNRKLPDKIVEKLKSDLTFRETFTRP